MVKKDDKESAEQAPKRVLATGASGDPEHPEFGVPTGAETYFEPAVVTETVTDASEAKKKGKD